MEVLIVSDIHGNIRRSREIVEKYGEKHFDYIFINGDITHFGDLREALNITSTISQVAKKSFFVPGNCDPRNLIEMEELGPSINVHSKTIELGEVKLHGVGGSTRTPFHTYIEFEEEEIKELLDWGIQGPFILMSHTPPRDTKIDRLFMGGHAGSIVIRDYIVRMKPLVSLHGHIHEAKGIDKVGKTIVVNPGPFRNGYYAVLKLEDMKPEIGLYQLT